jgi:hypothetical protein
MPVAFSLSILVLLLIGGEWALYGLGGLGGVYIASWPIDDFIRRRSIERN